MGNFIQFRSIISFLIYASTFNAYSNSDKIRVLWNDDPAHNVTIGWNAISGLNHRIYIDTIDHGTDTTLYSDVHYPLIANNDKGMENRFARISGLLANHYYYFVVVDNGFIGNRYYFKTGSDNQARVSIIAGGDSRNNRDVRQRANILVSKLKPDAVCFGGDYTELGTSSQWRDWFDDWTLTVSTDGRMTPLIVTRGNHESSNTIMVNLFDTPNDVYFKTSFAGLLNMFTLNSETSISGNQTNWLTNELQNDTTTIWKMAQYHRPMRPHVLSKGEGNDQYNNWAQLFYDYNVNLIIECDAHTVKTSYPIKPVLIGDQGFTIDTIDGSIYIGEGTWGAPLRIDDDVKSWTKNSGKFNQFKWLWFDKSKIEYRTVKTDIDVNLVSELDNIERFIVPDGLVLWKFNQEMVEVVEHKIFKSPMVGITGNSVVYLSASGNVNLSVNTFDADGTVQRVDYFHNGRYIGASSSFPFNYSWISSAGINEITARAMDNDGNYSLLSNSTLYIVGNVNDSVFVRITDGNDDAEENKSSGIVDLTSLDLELAQDQTVLYTLNQRIGLRFTDINIPQGAKIDSAFIQFVANEGDAGSIDLDILLEDDPFPDEYEILSNVLTQRSIVSDTVKWSPAVWDNDNDRGPKQRTPNLSALVQHLVDNPAWPGCGAMSFLVDGNGERSAYSYDGSYNKSAEVQIYYSIGFPVPVSEEQKPLLANKLHVFPNPNNGTCKLICDPCGDCECVPMIRAYNIRGKEIPLKYEKSRRSNFLLQFPDLSAGTIFILVNTNGEDYIEKISLTKF